MPGDEWPELEPEDLRQIGEIVQGIENMPDSDGNDSPIPDTK
jgi:hypothetical protein